MQFERTVTEKEDKLVPYIEARNDYVIRAKELTNTIDKNNKEVKSLIDKKTEENKKISLELKGLAETINKKKKKVLPILVKWEKKEQNNKFEMLEKVDIKGNKIEATFVDIKERAGYEFLKAMNIK